MHAYLRDGKRAPEGPPLHRVKLGAPLGGQVIPVGQAGVDGDDDVAVFCAGRDSVG